jgi:lysyl-tRNA synthetase class II
MQEAEQNDSRTHHHLEVHRMFHNVAKAFSEDQVKLGRLSQLTLELAMAQQKLAERRNHQQNKADQLAQKYFEAIPTGHLIEAAPIFMQQFQPSDSPLPSPSKQDQRCLEGYHLYR